MQKIMFNDRYGLTQAVIEGRKTMTRRVSGIPAYPRFKVDEVVAVAQSYKALGYSDYALDRDPKDVFHVRGTLGRSSGWNNKMFVRADACKAHIRITNIRCERLQEISDADCLKEGVRYIPKINRFYFEDGEQDEVFYFDNHREAFASLIDKVSGRGTWERNPWVVVYEFELVRHEK